MLDEVDLRVGGTTLIVGRRDLSYVSLARSAPAPTSAALMGSGSVRMDSMGGAGEPVGKSGRADDA